MLQDLLILAWCYGGSTFGSLFLVNRLLRLRLKASQWTYGFLIVFGLFTLPFWLSWDDPILVGYLMQVLAVALLPVVVFRKSLIQALGAAGISFLFIHIIVKTFFITGTTTTFNSLLSLNAVGIETLLVSLASDVFLWLCLFFVSKKDLARFFDRLYASRKGGVLVSVLVVVFILGWIKLMQYLSAQFVQSTESFEKLYLLSFVTVLGSIFFLLAIANVYYRNEVKNERLRKQEFVLQQQQAYIVNLEKLQHEIRAFQHDYKNMMVGLYHSSEGDASNQTLEYIRKNLMQFEQNLNENIQETTNLSRVQLEEVKGLLLSKMLKAKQLHIHVTLEVIKDVHEVFMDRIDFVRCLGILFDNAIEAAELCEDGFIRVALIQSPQQFVLIVQNSYVGNVSIADIWQNGYSTKGERRGVGLFSYRDLLDRYTNVVKETSVEEDCFVQILKTHKEERKSAL